jgi:hypothetical protein
MEQGQLNWVANFIWGIADDVFRDLYVRGKYRDVILPMTVLRRLDAVLEPTKQSVLDMKASLDKAKITNQDQALRQAAGQAFYNTSKFTLRDLKARTNQQQLKADFEAYLDGFSPNVQDILDNFEFRNQIPRLSKADALGTLIEKLTSADIDLSPSGLDNHGMGTVFEELVRRFNEENNEEAGEHWTPRDAVKLMANLIFLPIADEIESGTYLLYDGACGTGGMLTVAEDTLRQLAAQHGKQVATHLYGQEINAETYAICKADLLLKGEGDAADNIVGGPEHFGEVTLVRTVRPELLAHQFGVTLNGGQQIVEVVCDAAGQLSNRFDLLRLTELLLQHVSFGHIQSDSRRADWRVCVVVKSLARRTDPVRGAVRPLRAIQDIRISVLTRGLIDCLGHVSTIVGVDAV